MYPRAACGMAGAHGRRGWVGDELSMSTVAPGAAWHHRRTGQGLPAKHSSAPTHRCWSTNNNMGFWWILRFPVFLAILVSHLPTPSAPDWVWLPLACPTLHPAHGFSPHRSTSSSSSGSSRSWSPSSAHTRCATRTTSFGAFLPPSPVPPPQARAWALQRPGLCRSWEGGAGARAVRGNWRSGKSALDSVS